MQQHTNPSQQPAETTELPSRALLGERSADHGDDSGRAFRTETAERLHNMANAVRRIYAHPVLRPNEKLLSVANEVEAQAKIIRNDFDGQRQLLQMQRAALEEDIHNALRPTRSDWEPKAAELRSVLRSMTDDQRYAFLDQAKGTRDEAFLRFAVASVPPAMSGYSIGMHKDMLTTLFALKDPSLLSRPNDLKLRAERLKVVDADKVGALRELIGGAQ